MLIGLFFKLARICLFIFFTNLESSKLSGVNAKIDIFSTNLGTSQVEEKFLTFWYKLNCEYW